MQRYKLETIKVYDPSITCIIGEKTVMTPDDHGEYVKYEDVPKVYNMDVKEISHHK
jgi:hypothetical protein